jgi:hypothetical protein
MAASRKRPADFTGRKTEQLAAEHADEQAAKAEQVSMVTAKAVAANREVVDYTKAVVTKADDGTPVVVDAPSVRVRVNSTIEMLTFGHGNNYDFEEGREYEVPKTLADHLESKGLLWH